MGAQKWRPGGGLQECALLAGRLTPLPGLLVRGTQIDVATWEPRYLV